MPTHKFTQVPPTQPPAAATGDARGVASAEWHGRQTGTKDVHSTGEPEPGVVTATPPGNESGEWLPRGGAREQRRRYSQ